MGEKDVPYPFRRSDSPAILSPGACILSPGTRILSARTWILAGACPFHP